MPVPVFAPAHPLSTTYIRPCARSAPRERDLDRISRLKPDEAPDKVKSISVVVPYDILHGLLRVEVEDWFADRGVDHYSIIKNKVHAHCTQLQPLHQLMEYRTQKTVFLDRHARSKSLQVKVATTATLPQQTCKRERTRAGRPIGRSSLTHGSTVGERPSCVRQDMTVPIFTPSSGMRSGISGINGARIHTIFHLSTISSSSLAWLRGRLAALFVATTKLVQG